MRWDRFRAAAGYAVILWLAVPGTALAMPSDGESSAESTRNVSCGLWAWGAAGAEGTGVVATANGSCMNVDYYAPTEFEAFLDITFEYSDPASASGWRPYYWDGCTRSDLRSHAVFEECTTIDKSTHPEADGKSKRAVFTLGVFVDGEKQVRSTRVAALS